MTTFSDPSFLSALILIIINITVEKEMSLAFFQFSFFFSFSAYCLVYCSRLLMSVSCDNLTAAETDSVLHLKVYYLGIMISGDN